MLHPTFAAIMRSIQASTPMAEPIIKRRRKFGCLTETLCAEATCPAERLRLRLFDAGGLYLEVMPTGAKHWRWKYRFSGKEKRLALGSWPTTSIARARAEMELARTVLKAGADPLSFKHSNAGRSRCERLRRSLGVLLEEVRELGGEHEAREVEEIVLGLERRTFMSSAS